MLIFFYRKHIFIIPTVKGLIILYRSLHNNIIFLSRFNKSDNTYWLLIVIRSFPRVHNIIIVVVRVHISS